MIPLATTKISVTRVQLDPTIDPTKAGDVTPTIIAKGVRAVIDTPTASNKLSFGDRIVYTARLTCDPCDLQENDIITDSADGTETEWRVMWTRTSIGLGINHRVAQLRMITGAS